MDTLDRFLAKEFLSYFGFILLGWAVLFLGVDFLSKLGSYPLSTEKVIEIYLYRIPEALNQFVPIAALMATLLVLTNMSRQNEVLALYSAGISTFRIFSTFIAIVAAVSTGSFLVFDALVPSFTKKQIMIRKGLDPSSNHLVFNVKNGLWYRSKDMIFNVARYDPGKNVLENISIYRLTPNYRIREIIHARQAEYADSDWVLKNVKVTHYLKGEGFPESESVPEMRGILRERPTDFKSLEIQPSTMRLRDLRMYIERNGQVGLDTTLQQVQYHERVALVFAPLVFILLGMPFALKPLRSHSMAKSTAFCFVLIFLYLLTFRMSLSTGKGGHVPPFLAAWFPNFLFLGLSGILVTRRNA